MKYILLLICALSLTGCESLNLKSNRTITLDPSGFFEGELDPAEFSEGDVDPAEFSEEEHGPFESWVCRERYSDSRRILFEVGYFKNEPEFGFVLYDGTSSGELAEYRRTGIERRWNWRSGGGSYSFVLKPDGTGAYYDFTNVAKGEETSASSVYECKKR